MIHPIPTIPGYRWVRGFETSWFLYRVDLPFHAVAVVWVKRFGPHEKVNTGLGISASVELADGSERVRDDFWTFSEAQSWVTEILRGTMST